MSDRSKLPTLFKTSQEGSQLVLENKTLVLKAQEDFNEGSWGAWFGQIQQVLRQGAWKGKTITSCHLDFTDCRWADPLPLLSIAICMADFEKIGGSVSLAFPAPCVPSESGELNCDERSVDQSRLLKFLSREGLLQILAFPEIRSLSTSSALVLKRRVVTIGGEKITSDENRSEILKKLSELWVPLAFEESTCLKATLLNICRPEESGDSAPLDAIDQWVDQILYQEIEQVIVDKVPRWAHRSLTYRLLMFLRETLHNVAEHSYAESGFAAVYVRYREGALGQAPSTWRKLDRYIKREQDNARMPLLQTKRMTEAFARNRTGFFEVYVVDNGCGLCRTLGRSTSHGDSEPVHQAMLDVFDRWCSSKSERTTEYGGLYLIRLLLEPVRDYVRIRDEDTWWGSELPIPHGERGTRLLGQLAIKAYGRDNAREAVRGLAWTSRLSWLERGDIPGYRQPWRGIGKESAKLLSILQEATTDNSILNGIYIHDCRFSGEAWSKAQNSKEEHTDVLLLLPSINWMRNRIQEEIARVLTNSQLRDGGTLIIGDIASEEAITYFAAIQNAMIFMKPPFSILSRVILVTRELKVCVLERDSKGLLGESGKSSASYVRGGVKRDNYLTESLSQYFHVVRLHDAIRFWKIAGPFIKSDHPTTRNSMVEAFLDEHVDWNEGVILDCYLDFPQTLTHPVCRDIYTIALQRLTGLFPAQNCELTAIDPLVDSLVVRFNADRHPPPRFKEEGGRRIVLEAPRKHLRIGSIQVTGLTERSENEGNDPVFHLFKHPNGIANGYYLLPWLVSASAKLLQLSLDEQELPPGSYRRVGRTPVIARDGWKAYRLPRFDEHEQPVYEQAPRESYRSWQEPSRATMKIGHWHYGGHHDLLSINLMLAFDTELDRISLVLAGTLARWAYANLFRVFSVKSAHLTDAGKSVCKAIEDDGYRKLLPTWLAEKNAVLIYPSHPVTDHIIDRFLSLFKDHSALSSVRARIYAVLPVRRNRGGSGLQISGLMLDRLDRIRVGRKSKRPPVVFFDDAVISGRTYEELKRLLRSKGFEDIYSFVLLDRQRLPSADHAAGDRHVCHWRLDVPSIGSSAHCPLCRARSRIEDLASRIASSEHKRRIESWRKHWAARNPTTDWGDSGLRPVPISLIKPERKFGIVPDEARPGTYRQIGGKDQQIHLSNSAGLVAWVTELHSITSRDDLPLRIVSKEHLEPEVRIQLIASQLLLFFGELDSTLAYDLGLNLLAALWEAKEHDRNTALGVLTLIACGNKYLRKIIGEFLKDDVRKRLFHESKVDEAEKDLNWLNVDFIILLAFCMTLRVIKDQPQLERASRLLSPSGSRRDLYFRLHREVQDVQGAAHNPPLRRLVQWEELQEEPEKSIPDWVASVGQLRVISKVVEQHWLRADTYAHKEFGTLRSKIETTGVALEQRLHELDNIVKSAVDRGKSGVVFRKCKELAPILVEEGEKLHASLFMPIGIQTLGGNNDCKLMSELTLVFPNPGEINDKTISLHESVAHLEELDRSKLKKKNLVEAYVVWDSEIIWSLREILTNAKHAEGENIVCPWSKCGHSSEKADLWVRFFPQELYMVLELANPTSISAHDVEKATRLRRNRQVLRELGRDVEFEKQEGLLVTRIYLPYAHTLVTPR